MATLNRPRLFRAPAMLTAAGWRQDVGFRVDVHGSIEQLTAGTGEAAEVTLPGAVIPGMVNVHSHIHQRLMAGLSARRADQSDSFWTWRRQMYRTLELLDDERLGVLAAWGFMELLEGGYTAVGEFHYPHHLAAATPAESARRILASAAQAGCALTLLPVWYRYSGFGRQPPDAAQARFVLSRDELIDLIIELREGVDDHVCRIGVAPHSLRAVDVADLPALLERVGDGPIHMHIAEQPDEVVACREHSGLEPLDLLERHLDLDRRWCLIHATHVPAARLNALAATGAVLGICPSTEADLGDGLFPVAEFLSAGGRVAIGSDSNIETSAAAELRLLEWGQRLRLGQRNVLAADKDGLGTALWRHTARSGADALGLPAGSLEAGRRADFVVLQGQHPLLAGLTPQQQLDVLVTAGMPGMIESVWVGGCRRVSEGRHLDRDALRPAFLDLRRALALSDS